MSRSAAVTIGHGVLPCTLALFAFSANGLRMETRRTTLPRSLAWLSGLALLAASSTLAAGTVRAADPTGEQIFKQRCASCHGASGEGTEDEYPHPLAGERTVEQLAKFIAKSMPKNSEQKCSAADAEKVAAYIYDAFYSRAARERNQLPRMELARLTVRQYRNAVADLIGSFRPTTPWDDKRGLKATYFKSYGFRPKNQAFERVDPAVSFDFGEGSPEPKDIEADRFSIR
ncbi:MAG TPA: c-type cytochrome [Gemmataceae bacterium]|nr:c-type cytochrome [Gemmataceae bacterium]